VAGKEVELALSDANQTMRMTAQKIFKGDQAYFFQTAAERSEKIGCLLARIREELGITKTEDSSRQAKN
jgi:hypothetical protein